MFDDGQDSAEVADFGVPPGGGVRAPASDDDELDAEEEVNAESTSARLW